MRKNQIKWSKWYLSKEGSSGYTIRRYRTIEGKTVWERYPKDKYSDLKDTDLQSFLKRINLRTDTQLLLAKQTYEYQHAFITEAIKNEFRDILNAEIPSRRWAQNLFFILDKHCLYWFIGLNGKPDPIDWKREEKNWGLALMGKIKGKDSARLNIWEKPVHPNTIKKCIQIINRFLLFLHEKMPKEVPSITLHPISKAQMRLYKANFNSKDGYTLGRFIKDDHWETIQKKIDSEIKPYTYLAYYYGLRRTECMAIGLDSIFEDHLEVSRQLISCGENGPEYGQLKNRKPRSVPHWFITPDETYKLVSETLTNMHPDTFSDKFNKLMSKLDFEYNIHDLRRTFITKAFRAGKNPRDIQLAVGHSDLKTTLSYAQDDRELKKKRFVPKAG